MKNNRFFKYFLLFITIFLISCDKIGKVGYYEGEYDPNKVKEYKNDAIYPSTKMDSLEAITHITKQKLQEVYDLAILANDNKSNKNIDTTIVLQLKSYFPKNDSICVNSLINELDSLQVKYINLKLMTAKNDSILTDSTGNILYSVYYYNKNKKHIVTKEKTADFTLKRLEKSKSEFKFYFSKIYEQEKKEE